MPDFIRKIDHRTGKVVPEELVNIKNYVIAVYDSEPTGENSALCRPVLISMSGKTFLPIFSSAERLHKAFREHGKLDCPYKLKYIMGGREFLDSIKDKFSIIADPYVNADQSTVFQLISTPNDEPL